MDAFIHAGKSYGEIQTLLNTIDFSKPVREKILEAGTLVFRFEKSNAGEGGDKHFFTDAYGADAGAGSVGFYDPSGYKLVTYEVTKRTTVLESTIKGKKTTQYFSTELQKNIKKTREK